MENEKCNCDGCLAKQEIDKILERVERSGSPPTDLDFSEMNAATQRLFAYQEKRDRQRNNLILFRTFYLSRAMLN